MGHVRKHYICMTIALKNACDSVLCSDHRSRSTLTGNEYAAETDWSKEQDKGKVSKGRNTKRQNRSIQMSSLNDTREKILPESE